MDVFLIKSAEIT